MNKFDTDVLVIGSGAAGIRAAVAAGHFVKEVTLVTRGNVTEHGSTFSRVGPGWGIQALAAGERTGETLELFYEDIARVGLGKFDPRLAQIMVEESGQRLEDLISYGMRFQKEPDGRFRRTRGCFSSIKRAYLTADPGNIQETFLSILGQHGVRIVTGYATELMVTDGECVGAWIIDSSGEFLKMSAGATILATGGGAGVYRDHLVGEDQVGDGYALAYRAGARLTNMEFIQFMLGLKKNGGRRFFPIVELRKPGVLCDSHGANLLAKAFPDHGQRRNAVAMRMTHMPFSSRDESGRIDIAVARANASGVPVRWRTDGHWEEGPHVVDLAHAFNGGVGIDEHAESSVPGLFAAGEVAAGPHGADRIGGCMMTATQVFGERAGRYGALRARKRTGRALPDVSFPSSLMGIAGSKHVDPNLLGEINQTVQCMMTQHAAVLRCEAGLTRCLRLLEDCISTLEEYRPLTPKGFQYFFRTRNVVDTARLVARSARKRRAGMGCHYRDDQANPFLPRPTSPVVPISAGNPS